MQSKLMLSLTASAAVVLFQPTTQTVWAQGQSALTGTVSSEAEGNMEGVVVTANKPGSIVQLSVTTDAQGHYAFSENRLEPGEYTIRIRAGTPEQYRKMGLETILMSPGEFRAFLDTEIAKFSELIRKSGIKAE